MATANVAAYLTNLTSSVQAIRGAPIKVKLASLFDGATKTTLLLGVWIAASVKNADSSVKQSVIGGALAHYEIRVFIMALILIVVMDWMLVAMQR